MHNRMLMHSAAEVKNDWRLTHPRRRAILGGYDTFDDGEASMPCTARHSVCLFVLFSMLASASFAPAAEPAKKPNIIFILADDLGHGDLGCYGQTKIKTPNIDRLAAEGMQFTDFYAGSTVCAPSRCALMTGLNTGHARIRGNANVPLASGDLTVAEMLQGSGYHTGLIGKWGLGNEGT